jgi:hypothetical protein
MSRTVILVVIVPYHRHKSIDFMVQTATTLKTGLPRGWGKGHMCQISHDIYLFTIELYKILGAHNRGNKCANICQRYNIIYIWIYA